MSRHLQYLHCLRVKLKARYGDDDEIVLQVDTAVKSLEDSERRGRQGPALGTKRPGPKTRYKLNDGLYAASSTRAAEHGGSATA